MVTTTNDMHIDVRAVKDTHSAALQSIGSDESIVLIISSTAENKDAGIFIVFSPDMHIITGGIYADGHGHEIKITADAAPVVLESIELRCSEHQLTLLHAVDQSMVLDVNNRAGFVSIVDGEGNREDFQTTVLQELEDLGLDYSVASGCVSHAENVLLPADAQPDASSQTRFRP